MDLSIVIVNYNNYLLTNNCINSVINNISNIDYEIILIDNNSNNNSVEIFQNEYKKYNNIKVISNPKNVGFGAANNKAVEEAKGAYILILNPDTIIIDDSIEKMLNKISNNKDIGLISCKLLNEDKTLQYSCRRFLDFKSFIIARTPLKKLFPKKYIDKINSLYLMNDYTHDYETEVDWVMGSFMMIEKSLFQQVGGFSPQYFMYFEDVDLCFKIKIKNKKIIYSPNAQIIHLHRQESTKKINKLSFIHLSSMFKFYLTNKM